MYSVFFCVLRKMKANNKKGNNKKRMTLYPFLLPFHCEILFIFLRGKDKIRCTSKSGKITKTKVDQVIFTKRGNTYTNTI